MQRKFCIVSQAEESNLLKRLAGWGADNPWMLSWTHLRPTLTRRLKWVGWGLSKMPNTGLDWITSSSKEKEKKTAEPQQTFAPLPQRRSVQHIK